MNTAEEVSAAILRMKEQGVPLSEQAWKAGLMCVGWPYVFGARGQYCTPENRRSRYNGTPEGKDKDNIKNKCKNFNGSGSSGCSGCQWYPGNKFTRFFDCRGFTYWVLDVVFGWELKGAGCTTQWNTQSNWKAKGEVKDGIPRDVIVCLFYYKKDSKGRRTNTLELTGFYYNGETVECSGTVKYNKTIDKKWEVWGVPMCVEGVPPTPTPTTKPTLRRGDRGVYVALAQTELMNKGYSCGDKGADGIFGQATEAAVKRFQNDHTDESGKPLSVDGIIGAKTWAALESTEPATKYTVTVPHLTATQADALILQYPGSTKTEERG